MSTRNVNKYKSRKCCLPVAIWRLKNVGVIFYLPLLYIYLIQILEFINIISTDTNFLSSFKIFNKRFLVIKAMVTGNNAYIKRNLFNIIVTNYSEYEFG